MFANKKPSKWIWISLAVIFSISFIGFMVSWFKDYEIAWALGNIQNTSFGTWWSAWEDELGMGIVLIPLFIAIAIIIEAFFKHYFVSEKDNFFKRNRYLYWVAYACLFAALSFVISERIVVLTNTDIYAIDKKLLAPEWYRIAMWCTISAIDIIFISISFYFIHFRVGKRDDFLANKYWIDAIKIIAFVIMGYVFVVPLKVLMGRPFPWDTFMHYEQGFRDHVSSIDSSQNMDPSAWPEYHPWYWIWPDFSGRVIGLVTFSFNTADSDFPSGHCMPSFAIVTILFLFVGRGRKEDWKVKTAAGLWVIHQTFVVLGMVVLRHHWMTDMLFSMMLAIVSVWLANIIVEKSVVSAISNHEKRQARKL